MANFALTTLEPLIQKPDAVHGTLSEDDFHLYAMLRSLSIVRDLDYPDRVEAYRTTMAKLSQVPLQDEIAR
jgi:glutaredoxin 2